LIDQGIINGCINNDRKSQRTLYEFCYPIMMKVCKRYVVNEEDAIESVNQSFLKVIQGLAGLRDINTIAGWVKQISVNTSIDFYRSQKRYTERNRFTIDTEYSSVQQSHGGLDHTESKMDSREIFKLIAALPDTTREVLNMFAIDGFSHREIADMLHISEENSRWHLHKGRKLLSEQMNISTHKQKVQKL
jgi:RNA polymerase sigma factor (sigma-70 family)